jgi:hypothetical protein
MSDVEDDFDDMDAGKPPRSKAPAEKAKPKPAEKPAEPPEPPEPPAPEPSKPVEKPAAPPEEPKPTKMRELGQHYDDLKKKVREEYEPTIQSLKAKVTELESRKPEDTAPVLEKLNKAEAENKDLKKKLALVDATEDESYKKVDSEYSDAWHEAVEEFRGLSVKERDGEDENTGEPRFKHRPADDNDLLKLANMRPGEMDAAALEMFGPSQPRVSNLIRDLQKLSNAQRKALEKARSTVVETKAQRTIEQQQKSKLLSDTWESANNSLREKYPKAFQAEEGNADDVAGHLRGFALADLMFLGESSVKPEQVDALPASLRDTIKAGKPLSDVQKVHLHALARLKLANHDRKVVALKKANERIAELEKSLSEYEQSTPPAGKAGDSGEQPDSGKDWRQTVEEELSALDK